MEKLATLSGRVFFVFTHQDVEFDRFFFNTPGTFNSIAKRKGKCQRDGINHVTDVVSHSCYIVLRCTRMALPCTLALVQDRPSTRPVVALCTVPHTPPLGPVSVWHKRCDEKVYLAPSINHGLLHSQTIKPSILPP